MNQFHSELLGEKAGSFYIFLQTGHAGRSAMFLEGITWVHQEVILFQPVITGYYNELPVIKINDPFIPVRKSTLNKATI